MRIRAVLSGFALGMASLLAVTEAIAGSSFPTAHFARLGPPNAPVRLHFEEQGSGPPILLLHGFGASGFTWRHVAPPLSVDHRVITLDLKGFGQSDKPFDENYSVFDQAALVAEFIEERDLRDVTLVGHSFGGGVALVLAMQAESRLKGRIKRLVLLDTIAYPQTIPVFFRMLQMPLVSQLGMRMVPPAVQVKAALQMAYYDESKIGDEEVEVYTAPLRTAAGKHAIIHSARQIEPEGLEELSRRYNEIELPTLILWCDHDRIVPLDIGLKLRRSMPNSTLRIVRACGHMPQEEQPTHTLSLIRDFLSRTPAS
jgi:pimeloyl-ACP methyl ester carboxylesterase